MALEHHVHPPGDRFRVEKQGDTKGRWDPDGLRRVVDNLLTNALKYGERGMGIAIGVRRVSLETGAGEAFAPARALYAGAGFVPCGPFGDYRPSPNSASVLLGSVARMPL